MFMARRDRHFSNHTSVVRPNAAMWIGSAFCAALGLAATVLLTLGPGVNGTVLALQLTARLSFLLFWSAYSCRRARRIVWASL